MANRQLEFKGTHKEIGRQVGEQYRKWGKKEVYIPPLSHIYFPDQLSLYEEFFPEYVEYLEGIALGLGIQKDLVLTSYLTGFLNVATPTTLKKCSTFGAKNNQGVFIGRNYDWLESSEKISSLLRFDFTDNSANNFCAITDMGTHQIGKIVNSYEFVIMTDDGWNDNGLYISLNGTPDNNNGTGICVTHLIQLILEKCQTVSQAIELMTKLPFNESKIFTIADKNGNLAVVEKSLSKGTFIRKSNDFIITTNHYNSEELKTENLEIFKNVPFHATFARYHYLEYNLLKDKENLNLENIMKIMSKPPVIQNWRGIENGDIVTVWVSAIDLTKNKYLVEFAPILKTNEFISN